MFKALLLVMASTAGGLVSADDEGEQEGGAVTEWNEWVIRKPERRPCG